MDINLDIAFFLGTAIRWLVYTFLVWILIKIQKLQYSGLGLLLSTLAAVLTSFIPVVGPYATYAVLLFCLWRTTRANLAPDMLFTVTIAGALMFCVDLWAMSIVMGKLGYEDPEIVAEAAEPEEALTGVDASLAEAEISGPGGDASGGPPSDPVVEENSAVPVPVLVPRVRVHASGLSARGISYSATHPLAMLEAGQQVLTVAPGEGFTFLDSNTRVQVRCLEIHPTHVLVEINDTNRVELTLD